MEQQLTIYDNAVSQARQNLINNIRESLGHFTNDQLVLIGNELYTKNYHLDTLKMFLENNPRR